MNCGIWTDAWGDNWVSVSWDDETKKYKMEYNLYDAGIRGRQYFDKEFFDVIVRTYNMSRQA